MNLQVTIVTPSGPIKPTTKGESQEANQPIETPEVTLPCLEGQVTIAANHIPMVSALKPGVAYFRTGKYQHQYFALGKGFVEIFDNQVTIFAESAELAEDIDPERAEQALKNVDQKIQQSSKSLRDPAYKSLVDTRARAKARLSALRSAKENPQRKED